jgi:hypothetical protein
MTTAEHDMTVGGLGLARQILAFEPLASAST